MHPRTYVEWSLSGHADAVPRRETDVGGRERTGAAFAFSGFFHSFAVYYPFRLVDIVSNLSCRAAGSCKRSVGNSEQVDP
jgi:hypothetical protein